jgi:hypothetical protein
MGSGFTCFVILLVATGVLGQYYRPIICQSPNRSAFVTTGPVRWVVTRPTQPTKPFVETSLAITLKPRYGVPFHDSPVREILLTSMLQECCQAYYKNGEEGVICNLKAEESCCTGFTSAGCCSKGYGCCQGGVQPFCYNLSTQVGPLPSLFHLTL